MLQHFLSNLIFTGGSSLSSMFAGDGGGGRRSNILRETYMLFPLYRLGTTWDFIERAMNHEGIYAILIVM